MQKPYIKLIDDNVRFNIWKDIRVIEEDAP